MTIRLDADTVREEVRETAMLHYIDHELAERITELDDVTIHDAILDAATDRFWTIFDEVRSGAILALIYDLTAEEG